MQLQGLFFGTIEEVIAPQSVKSSNRYQYEYRVLISIELSAQVPVICIRNDPYGSFNNFDDASLTVGQRVFVMFPKGDPSLGVIMGGSRLYPTEQDSNLGFHKRHRFNELEELYSKTGAWRIRSDNGPSVEVSKTEITLDASSGDRIVLDRINKSVTIETNKWNVTVKGDATINVGGKASVTAKSADIKIAGKAQVEAGELEANIKGEARIKASKNATIDAKTIELNGSGGQVLTTLTQPVCYISGAPFKGTSKVKAG